MTLEEAIEVLATVMSKTGGCYMGTLGGQSITLHRRQRACLLTWRVGSCGEMESGDRRSCESESGGARAADGGAWPLR